MRRWTDHESEVRTTTDGDVVAILRGGPDMVEGVAAALTAVTDDAGVAFLRSALEEAAESIREEERDDE